ncbi:MBL fold metallo-hydrolase [Chitinivorax sp. B]|uniref:MBL fold metallo-hydrolase n=1 Tax=Chitinivorax sp. B TaxID=2502235 RepID=UPI0010F66A78|nr:MBL fold metallo-hydrolase [Chitinivorax sp. B]
MTLPPSMQVICRGWLNANHVLFLHAGDNVLIDTGYCTHADETLRLLRQPSALGDAPLHRILNTHCHSDHMGGNARLQQVYGCRVLVPAAEAQHIQHWDGRALWLDVAGQRAESFEVDGLIAPGDELWLGGTRWQALAAPGHRMEALVFYCPAYRVLISGDALWANGLGVINIQQADALDAALATLDMIDALPIDWVIPGHGWPFNDAKAAIVRARQRLEATRRDPVKAAWAMLKALFIFNLLEHGSLSRDAAGQLLGRVDFYRELNQYYLQLSNDELAEKLLADLVRSGAIYFQQDHIFTNVMA